MKNELALLFGIPVLALSLNGCSGKPDLASGLMSQCEADPNLQTATESLEVAPGEAITINREDFTLTDKGRLRLIGNDVEMEIESSNGPRLTYFLEEGYLIQISPIVNSNKSTMEISDSCQNVSKDFRRLPFSW